MFFFSFRKMALIRKGGSIQEERFILSKFVSWRVQRPSCGSLIPSKDIFASLTILLYQPFCELAKRLYRTFSTELLFPILIGFSHTRRNNVSTVCMYMYICPSGTDIVFPGNKDPTAKLHF